MPFLNIKTNRELSGIETGKILAEASRLCAEALGKPEDYMAVSIEPSAAMLFGGSEAPFAFLELRSIGLPEDAPARLSPLLCGFIEEKLQIEGSRIYLNFENIERTHWGWNGSTFG